MLCITWIMHHQLWGYKVEDKLHLGVREQKRLNTTDIDYLVILASLLVKVFSTRWIHNWCSRCNGIACLLSQQVFLPFTWWVVWRVLNLYSGSDFVDGYGTVTLSWFNCICICCLVVWNVLMHRIFSRNKTLHVSQQVLWLCLLQYSRCFKSLGLFCTLRSKWKFLQNFKLIYLFKKWLVDYLLGEGVGFRTREMNAVIALCTAAMLSENLVIYWNAV
jgi:hypothetical protein